MEVEAHRATAGRGNTRARAYPATRRGRPEFPGCGTITLKCDEIATWEGRFELWDAATETAWVVQEPTSAIHEFASHRIPALGEVIASVRGSPITCFGSMDLELLDEHGGRRRILQADQSVYLYPERARLPDARGMVVGMHDFPDVVLEVDHTTDVHRGKLWFYEEWGSRRYGWRCRSASRRAAPRGSGRVSPSTSSRARNTVRRERAGRFRAGPRTRSTWR